MFVAILFCLAHRKFAEVVGEVIRKYRPNAPCTTGLIELNCLADLLIDEKQVLPASVQCSHKHAGDCDAKGLYTQDGENTAKAWNLYPWCTVLPKDQRPAPTAT